MSAFYPAMVEINRVVYKRVRMMREDGGFPEPRDYIGKYIYLIGPQSVDNQPHMAKVESVEERGMYITFIFDEPIVIGGTNQLRLVSWYEPNGVVPIAYETTLKSTIQKKALNQSIRNLVERRMGIASERGSGPANLIRAYSGMNVPKGAEGASSYGPGAHPKWVRRRSTSKERGARERRQKNMGMGSIDLYRNYFGGAKRSRKTRRKRRD